MDYKDWEQLMLFHLCLGPVELGSTEDSADWNKQKTRVFPGRVNNVLLLCASELLSWMSILLTVLGEPWWHSHFISD